MKTVSARWPIDLPKIVPELKTRLNFATASLAKKVIFIADRHQVAL